MIEDQAVTALSALAQATRLRIFRLLVQAGSRGLVVNEIGEAIATAPATLSFHLKALTQAGLIQAQNEGRFIRYIACYEAMNDLLRYLTENCCGGLGCENIVAACNSPASCSEPTPNPQEPAMNQRVFNVLFLCTGNSARSILAEAILNHVGAGRFRAFSAGSHPTGRVNPFAIELLRQRGLDVAALCSKNWDEFARPDAPSLDFIFTVCDNAAGEVCPVWPGKPMTAHWGIADPAAVEGSDDDKRWAFSQAFHLLNRRIGIFVSLSFDKLDALSMQRKLDDIGRMQDDGAEA